ncbi:MAG: DNA cytosine methyltransferase [Oscillospiraceae bacterium]|jgi:DNA (cytosine-5)-methyltransferase 1|nr:DNA cytosine methyltransferase [Oscillospiraceae bacterium]
MMKIVDLFAGCGGMSLGFQNAGYEIIGAFELWELAADCYEHNFGHPVYREDLSDTAMAIGKIKSLNPDMIIGGPPCQDFSHAGKRVENERANLTESFAKIVAGVHPQWFVMENVDRAQKSHAYARARSIFQVAGYKLTEIVLDASRCGVPQKRKRFFCIGSLGQTDGFLYDYMQEKLSEKETTIRDYFGNTLEFDYYYRHPRNYNRRAIYSIDEPAPTVRGMNRPVPPGYPGHPNDAKPNDGTIRAMTTLERALVQTFPANFKWIGNKTDTEQMIGNAVPVKLAEFVARALAHNIEEYSSSAVSQVADIDCVPFFNWLKDTQNLSERTKRDTVSRLKRADALCTISGEPNAYYLFRLEQQDGYKRLAPTVRSQLKRAVMLYNDYCHSAISMI